MSRQDRYCTLCGRTGHHTPDQCPMRLRAPKLTGVPRPASAVREFVEQPYRAGTITLHGVPTTLVAERIRLDFSTATLSRE